MAPASCLRSARGREKTLSLRQAYCRRRSQVFAVLLSHPLRPPHAKEISISSLVSSSASGSQRKRAPSSVSRAGPGSFFFPLLKGDVPVGTLVMLPTRMMTRIRTVTKERTSLSGFHRDSTWGPPWRQERNCRMLLRFLIPEQRRRGSASGRPVRKRGGGTMTRHAGLEIWELALVFGGNGIFEAVYSLAHKTVRQIYHLIQGYFFV